MVITQIFHSPLKIGPVAIHSLLRQQPAISSHKHLQRVQTASDGPQLAADYAVDHAVQDIVLLELGYTGYLLLRCDAIAALCDLR